VREGQGLGGPQCCLSRGGGVSCIFAETVAWVLLSGPAEQHCGAFCGRVFAVCACWWCGVISACSQLQKGGAVSRAVCCQLVQSCAAQAAAPLCGRTSCAADKALTKRSWQTQHYVSACEFVITHCLLLTCGIGLPAMWWGCSEMCEVTSNSCSPEGQQQYSIRSPYQPHASAVLQR
jgi:hypothetical protein